MNYKKFLAFTLAEVMITMTIVGAIASMTIPTLINKRVQAERSAKLKNFYSKMINAVDQMVSDGNSYEYMSAPDSVAGFYDWYLKNLDRYVGHALLDRDNYTVYFVDESSMHIGNGTDCRRVLYDTNGVKTPNKEGYDQYRFLFCFTNAGRRTNFGGNDTIFFGVYNPENEYLEQKTEQEVLNKCKSDVQYCTKVLQNNNWDYPPNYPFK